MNQKLCKALRTIAHENNPSSMERKHRNVVIVRDLNNRRKMFDMLVALDPRAQYQSMKKVYSGLKGLYKIEYIREAKNVAQKVKEEFPGGHREIFDRKPSYLKHVVDLQRTPEVPGNI